MKRATRSEWLRRVQAWRASGQTAREFSAREGLNPGTLLWWSSQLGRESNREPARFLEIPMSAVRPAGRLQVVVRDAVRIEVSGEFEPELLRRVVAALEAR